MIKEQEDKFEKLLIEFFNEVMPPGTDNKTRTVIMCEIEDKFDDIVSEWCYGKQEGS